MKAGPKSFGKRFRSATTPRVRSQIKVLKTIRNCWLLMAFVTERGRLPEKRTAGRIQPDCRNLVLCRAFQIILQATDPKEWKAIAEKRRQDLLVYLALGQFSHPKLGDLAPVVQEDIKALFGTYKTGWRDR